MPEKSSKPAYKKNELQPRRKKLDVADGEMKIMKNEKKKLANSGGSNTPREIEDEIIKSAREASQLTLRTLQEKNNALTASYSKGGNLPMSFVWPLDSAPNTGIDKERNPSLYPLSEYKENFIPFGFLNSTKINLPIERSKESPIVTDSHDSTLWKSHHKVDFVTFDDKNNDNDNFIAGIPPCEDIGKVAPRFFAWELLNPKHENGNFSTKFKIILK
jgi:hypothetical protein